MITRNVGHKVRTSLKLSGARRIWGPDHRTMFCLCLFAWEIAYKQHLVLSQVSNSVFINDHYYTRIQTPCTLCVGSSAILYARRFMLTMSLTSRLRPLSTTTVPAARLPAPAARGTFAIVHYDGCHIDCLLLQLQVRCRCLQVRQINVHASHLSQL